MADRKAVFNGVKLMIEKQQGRWCMANLDFGLRISD
jgi:hypothetical protein